MSPRSSVKQGFQAMEVCSRPKVTGGVYDINQNNSAMIGNFLPSTTGNITLTFNNHLNSLTNQVRCDGRLGSFGKEFLL